MSATEVAVDKSIRITDWVSTPHARSLSNTMVAASSGPTAPTVRTGTPRIARARDVFAALPPTRYSMESTNDVVPK